VGRLMDVFPLVVMGVMIFVWMVFIPKGGDDE
jgi:hypothetical protein